MNDDLLKTLTYKEFKDLCQERACDGRWSMLEAMVCIDIIETIDNIQVKALGFIPLRKKTEQAREEAWQKIINK